VPDVTRAGPGFADIIMSANKLAGQTSRTNGEGPISQNSCDYVGPDQPGPVADDGGSTCEHCGFTTLNGWELRLVAADELDYDVRGYNALLCDDCREELRVDGGRRWRAPAVGQENNRLPICDYCGCFIEETDQPCAALHAGVCAP